MLWFFSLNVYGFPSLKKLSSHGYTQTKFIYRKNSICMSETPSLYGPVCYESFWNIHNLNQTEASFWQTTSDNADTSQDPPEPAQGQFTYPSWVPRGLGNCFPLLRLFSSKSPLLLPEQLSDTNIL